MLQNIGELIISSMIEHCFSLTKLQISRGCEGTASNDCINCSMRVLHKDVCSGLEYNKCAECFITELGYRSVCETAKKENLFPDGRILRRYFYGKNRPK